jgi:hypothetical protein
VDALVPQHRGWAQLAGDQLRSRDRAADHSPQPELHGDVRPQSGVRRRVGRHGRRPALLRNARHGRQRRPPRSLGREGDEGSLEHSAAAVVPHRRAFDGGRHRIRRRPRPYFPRRGREHRKNALADSPRHIGAGFSCDVHRRRKTVRRRDHWPRRRQPPQCAAHDSSRYSLSGDWERDLRVCIALVVFAQPVKLHSILNRRRRVVIPSGARNPSFFFDRCYGTRRDSSLRSK